jgi:hypothetical protein
MNTNIFVYVLNLFIVYLACNHPRVKCQYRINLTPTAHSLKCAHPRPDPVTGEKSSFELSKPSSSMATKSSSGASFSIA